MNNPEDARRMSLMYRKLTLRNNLFDALTDLRTKGYSFGGGDMGTLAGNVADEIIELARKATKEGWNNTDVLRGVSVIVYNWVGPGAEVGEAVGRAIMKSAMQLCSDGKVISVMKLQSESLTEVNGGPASGGFKYISIT